MKKDQFKEKKILGFIGMRVSKTVVAVFLCFLLSYFRKTSAFYSAIAAILCMKTDQENSLKTGINRLMGTFVGGVYGFLGIILMKGLGLEAMTIPYYAILSLLLIPIIYSNIYLGFADSSYISCVVFLSITVSHIQDLSPMLFALNRTIETSIGILISILINKII